MKILVVSSFLPYPLYSGGHVRLYNLLKELSTRHDITLVCEKRKYQTQADIDAVKKMCKEVYVVDRKKQWSPEVVFRTVISTCPFLIEGHRLPAMKKIIADLLQKEAFDVIHVETFYVMQNVPATNVPIVLVEHNIEYTVYQRFADTAPLLLRPVLQVDVEKIKYWEKTSWEKADAVVGVSQVEAKQMRSDAVVVPNGVSLTDFPFKKSGLLSKNPVILFMGDFKWIQNRNTAMWILKDIWPKIKTAAALWIVGKHIPDNIKAYASGSIIIDEHAPDKTSDIYKKADVLLSPIRVGGGTSYKILEAMASGVPVVTTKLGVEGLHAKAGEHAYVAETPDEIAQKTIAMLTQKKEQQRIRKNARKFIEENYSWTKIATMLEEVYHDAVKH